MGLEQAGTSEGISASAESEALPSAAARAIARRIYTARASRAAIVGEGLFADPAWDMLIDLAICQGHRRLSVSAACVGAQVSHATAMRHLAILLERGLVERTPDAIDRRRTYVRLTRQGVDAMEAALLRFA